VILAHAFGQRYDLPIPLLLFVLGGAVIVVVSFLFVMPRAVDADGSEGDTGTVTGTDNGTGTGTGTGTDHARDASFVGPFRPGGVVGVLALACLIWCGLAGAQESAENIVPTVFWVIVWIAVPLSCGLIGDWTRPVNPFAFVAGLADRPALRAALLGGPQTVTWPRWLGWWPAVALFFCTACGELIFNQTATLPANTALALLIYAVVSAVAGLVFGRAWLERGELFSVLLSTWGKLGYFRFGAPGRRGLAGGLDGGFEASASRITFVLLLLVSVNFDGLLATPAWSRWEKGLPGGLESHTALLEEFRTVTFLALALMIAVLFGAFAFAAGRAGRQQATFAGALTGLLPSLLPIAFGYLLAHNLQYLLVNGQLLFPLIGNPLGSESWPIHLPYPFSEDYEVRPHFLPSAVYWYVSVVVIIAVHVIAVVLAHRHLGRHGSDRQAARASEYPWLVAMVAYTMLSLWLIAQPLVNDTPADSTPSAPSTPSATSRILQ